MARTVSKGLTKAQRNRFRKLMEAKASEIRTSLQSSSAAKALARGDEPLDLEDLPTQSHEEWIFLNRNNIDAMLLREIGEALGRVEDESYGICMGCDDPISLKRLDAVAWARYCVPCQEEISEHSEEEPRKPFR